MVPRPARCVPPLCCRASGPCPDYSRVTRCAALRGEGACPLLPAPECERAAEEDNPFPTPPGIITLRGRRALAEEVGQQRAQDVPGNAGEGPDNQDFQPAAELATLGGN